MHADCFVMVDTSEEPRPLTGAYPETCRLQWQGTSLRLSAPQYSRTSSNEKGNNFAKIPNVMTLTIKTLNYWVSTFSTKIYITSPDPSYGSQQYTTPSHNIGESQFSLYSTATLMSCFCFKFQIKMWSATLTTLHATYFEEITKIETI